MRSSLDKFIILLFDLILTRVLQNICVCVCVCVCVKHLLNQLEITSLRFINTAVDVSQTTKNVSQSTKNVL